MLEELVPLDPVHFFAFQMDCHASKGRQLEKKHKLPDLSDFHDAIPFADVYIGWREKGIDLQFHIQGTFDRPDFPDFLSADSIELFFDTRDVKSAGFPTRFCHHFFFLPEAIQANGDTVQAGEITRFRTDDTHELCDPTLLWVAGEREKRKRVIKIFIPSECIHGYDPAQFDRLGFTYRINRIDGSRQNFSASGADFPVESQPSLWASLKLVNSQT